MKEGIHPAEQGFVLVDAASTVFEEDTGIINSFHNEVVVAVVEGYVVVGGFELGNGDEVGE